MPYIQPIIETLQDDPAPTHADMMDMTSREPLTAEDLEKWGQREGESDLDHCLRCSHQIFETHESMHDDHHDDI